MNNEIRSKESYLYKLKLENMYVNKECLIKGNINVDNMKVLILYIQCKYYDILPQSMLTPLDFQKILVKCYGMESTSAIGADEIIDLHWNFKENFNKEKIDNVMNKYEIYESRGLVGELRKIVDLAIEQWR